MRLKRRAVIEKGQGVDLGQETVNKRDQVEL